MSSQCTLTMALICRDAGPSYGTPQPCPCPIKPDIVRLIIPTNLQFIATRLTMTPYQPDAGGNNSNAMFKVGSIREGFTVNHRLSDPRFWCFKTNVPDGLKHFVRKAIRTGSRPPLPRATRGRRLDTAVDAARGEPL